MFTVFLILLITFFFSHLLILFFIFIFYTALEQKLVAMENAEQVAAYLKEKGCVSAIPKIIRTGYHALDLVHYFTAGHDEVRAWTIRVSSILLAKHHLIGGTAVIPLFVSFFMRNRLPHFTLFKW